MVGSLPVLLTGDPVAKTDDVTMTLSRFDVKPLRRVIDRCLRQNDKTVVM
jgi:hypothetical protein